MHRLPIFWLPLVLAVLTANRCATGSWTREQLRQLISTILYNDELFSDVLLERVKLDDVEDVSPYIKETVRDTSDVHPLLTLHSLTTNNPHYSGYDLDLSLAIVGKSLTCLTHKRVALHLALIIRLIEEADGQAHFKVRSKVFAHALTNYMDMLSTIDSDFDKLLDVYHKVVDMSSSEEAANDEEHSDALKGHLDALNAVIGSSCVVSEMKDYIGSLNLDNLKQHADVIAENNRIHTTVDVTTSVKALKENENAIMDLFDEMDSVRTMDRGVSNVLLNIPDLPDDPNEFKRTPLPRYRDEVEDILRKIPREELLVQSSNSDSKLSDVETSH